ncbi:hypothetical protein NDU88_008213 [Pleurodeles waltl]|uniref:Uncharacterized protein n=1 Tax=Pleurodeles waltl TaxID=8319 RepID=A0AAV7SUN8_PLEWA|nr:hypothetical protein NDU88_008213 [Pleurodeles waltl]
MQPHSSRNVNLVGSWCSTCPCVAQQFLGSGRAGPSALVPVSPSSSLGLDALGLQHLSLCRPAVPWVWTRWAFSTVPVSPSSSLGLDAQQFLGSGRAGPPALVPVSPSSSLGLDALGLQHLSLCRPAVPWVWTRWAFSTCPCVAQQFLGSGRAGPSALVPVSPSSSLGLDALGLQHLSLCRPAVPWVWTRWAFSTCPCVAQQFLGSGRAGPPALVPVSPSSSLGLDAQQFLGSGRAGPPALVPVSPSSSLGLDALGLQHLSLCRPAVPWVWTRWASSTCPCVAQQFLGSGRAGPSALSLCRPAVP